MIAVLVTGPNASGKTTAVQKALEEWTLDSRVAAVHADNRDRGLFADNFDALPSVIASPSQVVVLEGTSRIANAVGRITDGSVIVVRIHGDLDPFNKLGPADCAEVVGQLMRGPAHAIVAEGTDRFARACAAAEVPFWRRLHVAMTITEPAVMRENLMARCAKRGKRFNAEYWDEGRLTYEGTGRYVNMAKRLFPGATFWRIGQTFSGQERLVEHIRALVREALG